jgi:hypothetical protein
MDVVIERTSKTLGESGTRYFTYVKLKCLSRAAAYLEADVAILADWDDAARWQETKRRLPELTVSGTHRAIDEVEEGGVRNISHDLVPRRL